MNNEPYDSGGITAAQWATIRKHCEKGDEPKAFDACVAAGIDPRAARMFCIALAYAREAGEIQQAAEGAHDIRRDTAEELRMLRNAQPISVDEARRIRAEIKELQGKHDAAIAALENARIASVRLRGLQERLPALFGFDRLKPIVGDAPPAYRAELDRLGLSDGVDPWKQLATFTIPTQPRKRVTSPLFNS